jgi:hypothetical protein
MGAAVGIGVLAVLTTILASLFFLALYLLFAFGLFTMAKKRELANPWMAFIPLANFYLLGKLIGPFYVLKYLINPPEIILIIVGVLFFGLTWVPYAGSLLASVALVVLLFGLYSLYSRLDNEKAFFYTIVSAVLPTIAIPILFFMLRNK